MASKEEKDKTELKKKMFRLFKDAKIPETDEPFPVFLRLDYEKILNLPSGSCFLPEPKELKDKVAVCKEGKTIKIFKLEEEKK